MVTGVEVLEFGRRDRHLRRAERAEEGVAAPGGGALLSPPGEAGGAPLCGRAAAVQLEAATAPAERLNLKPRRKERGIKRGRAGSGQGARNEGREENGRGMRRAERSE